MSDAGVPPVVATLTDALRQATAPATRVRFDRSHGDRRRCPGCGRDCMRIAIVDLAYTFEVCECRNGIGYDHLVEQLWHRECLASREETSDE